MEGKPVIMTRPLVDLTNPLAQIFVGCHWRKAYPLGYCLFWGQLPPFASDRQVNDSRKQT